MGTLEIVSLAFTAVGVIVATVDLYVRRGDFGKYGLNRAKNELLQRAADRAQELQSASTLAEVGFDLNKARERRAARALALEGRATLQGDSCWIAVDKTPVLFRHALAMRQHELA